MSDQQPIEPKYDPYTYLVVDPDGMTHYVSKRDFEFVDERLGFTKRRVGIDGFSIIGFCKQYLGSDCEH